MGIAAGQKHKHALRISCEPVGLDEGCAGFVGERRDHGGFLISERERGPGCGFGIAAVEGRAARGRWRGAIPGSHQAFFPRSPPPPPP